MTNKNKSTQSSKPMPLNQNWIRSGQKHIFVVKQLDQHGQARTIGYTRTRTEADLLIYDEGKLLFQCQTHYRAQKGKYAVTYSYHVEDASTRFILHERSLGFLYNGHKIDRFVITLEKINRAYNSKYDLSELEAHVVESEIYDSHMKDKAQESNRSEGEDSEKEGSVKEGKEAEEVEEAEESIITEPVKPVFFTMYY